jgi:hypothetical protein
MDKDTGIAVGMVTRAKDGGGGNACRWGAVNRLLTGG